jgi:hypothetical protein
MELKNSLLYSLYSKRGSFSGKFEFKAYCEWVSIKIVRRFKHSIVFIIFLEF